VIGLTTGRQTSQRLNSLLRDLSHAIPQTKIIRRGRSSLDDLASRFLQEGVSHALMIHRWHGSPGHINLLHITPTGANVLAPSIVLRSVKLRREYEYSGVFTANALTLESQLSDEAKKLCGVLEEVLHLHSHQLPAPPSVKASFHMKAKSDGTIELALTSPPGQREVGPKLTIQKLLWDVDEATETQ